QRQPRQRRLDRRACRLARQPAAFSEHQNVHAPDDPGNDEQDQEDEGKIPTHVYTLLERQAWGLHIVTCLPPEGSPGRPPEESRRCRPASCASCRPSAFPAASSCARCPRHSTWP